MKTFTVLDSSLRSVSQGENIFPVEDGQIQLPDDIAVELIACGQIERVTTKAIEGENPEPPMTAAQKKAAAKAAKEAAAKAAEESVDGE